LHPLGAEGFMRRLLMSVVVLLAACGGGGGGGGASTGGGSTGGGSTGGGSTGGGSTGGGSTGGGSVTPSASPTAPEAARFLTQATFGPTDSEITGLTQSNFAAWVDAQMAMAPTASHQRFLEQRLVAMKKVDPNASLGGDQFYQSFWVQAATAPDQLRQRIVFALSQIFVISLNETAIQPTGGGAYYDMLGANAFGNFRNILEGVTRSPSMAIYLTYMANEPEEGARTPDQNFAREIMQLMTIGLVQLNNDGTAKTDAFGQPIPTYSTADIQGLAKVFTGLSWYNKNPSWASFIGDDRDPDLDTAPLSYYPQWHSKSRKAFLGTVIPASTTSDPAGDVKIALDALFNHPNVGPFIAHRLIQQLVTSNPTPAYVGRVATVFNNNGSGVRGDMKAVIKAVLLDTEARDMAAVNSTTFGKLREPDIRLANWMRAFGASSWSGTWNLGSLSTNTSLSQSPLNPPSVFNFWRPGYVPPAATQLGARSLVAPEFQIVDEVSVAGYVNTIYKAITDGAGIAEDVHAEYAAEMAIADNAGTLIDRLDRLLLYGQMSAKLRGTLTTAINSISISGTQSQQTDARRARAQIAIVLVMCSPEYLVQR
jgi:uncharacterized protein (DUF1800 family)